MGHDTTTTLSEIEAARQRLERDLDELDRRARPEHDLSEQVRRVGVATVATGVLATLVVALLGRRLRTRRRHRRARAQAELVADVLADRELVVPRRRRRR